MRQAIHIFRKDVRHLWPEITAVLLLAALFTFTGVRRASWLSDPGANRSVAWMLLSFFVPLSWWALTARAIYGEIIPGERQFWITRPYSWKSLLAAKALFIAVFINVPVLLAQACIVRAYGFPLTEQAAGLLWKQVLLTGVFVLPIAALSAITSGFVQLLLMILILSVAVSGFSVLWAEMVTNGATSAALDWVLFYIDFTILCSAAILILLWQYSRRRTNRSRIAAALVVLVLMFGVRFVPWTAVYKIQSLASARKVDTSGLRIEFDSARVWAARVLDDSSGHVRIDVPLRISGVPTGMQPRFDGLTATLHAPDGTFWTANDRPWSNIVSTAQAVSFRTSVDQSFYQHIKGVPLRITGSLYVTLYGGPQGAVLPVQNRALPVPGAGVCTASGSGAGQPHMLLCSTAFRARPSLVSIHFTPVGREGLREVPSYISRQRISYSPFPAEPEIDPITQYFTYSSFQGAVSSVVVESIQPLAHVRRDFKIAGIGLPDAENPRIR